MGPIVFSQLPTPTGVYIEFFDWGLIMEFKASQGEFIADLIEMSHPNRGQIYLQTIIFNQGEI